MKVSVVGTGYVGIVSGVVFAARGHDVTCIDVDAGKVERINRGIPPIFEEGLGERLKEVIASRKFSASTSYDSVGGCDVALICVGTPSAADGSIDLDYVRDASRRIGSELRNAGGFVTVTVKSTVVPGTTRSLIPVLEAESGKKAGVGFGVGMVPEFLREGTAIEDALKPDRLVIGASDGKAMAVLKQLHSGFECPVMETDTTTAEMVKYASNSFLATKISFANELSRACEKWGVNVDEVVKGMAFDKRIAPAAFFNAGPGFGGSCFPKDVKALVAAEKAAGLKPLLLQAVLDTNEEQKRHVAELMGDVKGKRVAVLGLAFKAGTDDVRESPAIAVVDFLLKSGAVVVAYDPQAMENFRKVFAGIDYAGSADAALKAADACVIVTEWPEFRKPASLFRALMKMPVVVDSRRLLDARVAVKEGLDFKAVGVGKLG